ncbi:MAG: PAS domain-containing protein [Bacteroidetes bacterium]|nr:PAS domain-containing protein [Bacteroidota bacterium]
MPALDFDKNEIAVILDNINIGIAKMNAENKLTYANPAFCNMVGYSREELDMQHYSLFVKEYDNVELEYWDTLLKTGKLEKMTNLVGITTKENMKVVCNGTIIQVKNKDDEISYLIIFEDISEKISSDKELKENLVRYTVLGKATVEGLWDWNIKTGQLYYNNNVKTLLGYTDDDLESGFEWWKANIHPDDKDKILDKINAAFLLPNITSLNNEYRFAGKDGQYKIIADCFSILRNNEGEPIRLIVSMQDFTEQRNLQKQLAEKEVIYRRQLARTVLDTQEKERKKLAEELHDNVNQLLGVVKLYIEHSITNENIREGLLKKSNEYIDKVIEELRNLSKSLSPPLLAELGLEQSITSLADAISGVQHISVIVDMVDFNEEGLTESHKLMLYRIVQEQLNNIIKHAEAKNVEINFKKTGEKVELIIKDDGKGTDLTVENNDGFGLRNIRNRIELYHGTIDMITSPGNGFILKVAFEV